MCIHRGLRKALLISSKQDATKTMRNTWVYEGEEYEAKIKFIDNKYIILEFNKNGRIHSAFISLLETKYNIFKIDEIKNIKIISYNKEHKRYNAILIKTEHRE